MERRNKAVVLLSGGMDSAVVAAIARHSNDEVIALNVFYGQVHDIERSCAREQVKLLGLDKYIELNIGDVFAHMKSSLLRLSNIAIDDDQPKNEIGATYVPARNSVLLSIAAGIADTVGARFIYYGAHADDYHGYPDCRPTYYKAMRAALKEGTRNRVRLIAPFILSPKSEIVEVGMKLGVKFEHTHSCYRGKRPACGTCSTCRLRLEAFKQAGFVDPLEYEVR